MAGRIPKVVVVGPCYVDMAIKCEEFPRTGQIVEGAGFSCKATGAGPNRAIVAALCDCESHLIGKVGDDIMGQMIRKNLQKNKVVTDHLFIANAISTGVNLTMVNSVGENSGCVSAGANRALSKDEVECAEVEQLIGSADICLLHSSLGVEVVKSVIRTASIYKTKVILEAELSLCESEQIDSLDWPMEYFSVNILIPAFSQGNSAGNSDQTAGMIHKLKLIGSEFIARGVECVVLKSDARGCFLVERDGTKQISDFENECIASHASCDDAFAGALAASCGAGDTPENAVKFAAAASSISAGRIGDQDSLPTKQEIIQLLQNYPD